MVIAIIGILAALLLPTLGIARARARQANCMSNMRQLGHAVYLYADDFNGTLPSPTEDPNEAGCWFYAIGPYLYRSIASGSPTLQQRLAVVKQDPIWLTFDAGAKTNSRTIKMNRKLVGHKSEGTSVKVSDAKPPYRQVTGIERPSTTVLFFDGRCEDTKPTDTAGKKRYDGWEPYVALRHDGGANVLFVDGHMEWRREKLETTGAALGWASGGTLLDWWVD